MTNRPPALRPFSVKSDFKSLMSSEWELLHPDIRSRFSLAHCHSSTVYRGTMRMVRMSWIGRLFAHFCRLLGTPLSYYEGSMVPCEVKVYPNKHLGGMMWDRYYKFSRNRVNRVRSTKVILPECGLIEVAISGFGMYSKVYAKNGAIVFESKRFFCTLLGKKIPIPHLLSPGKTIASQRALSNGEFEFSLRIRHPIFGDVFDQIGIFSECNSSTV